MVDGEISIARGLQSGNVEPFKDIIPNGGRLAQMGEEPLKNIDLAYAESSNMAELKEKKINKREFELKRLFLRYVKKYKLKWRSLVNYPKQIKQKPAWFDLALSTFGEDQISSKNKKIIKDAMNALWEYRDNILPERVMTEEESLRQYGINSPYYQPPEDLSMIPDVTGPTMTATDEILQSQPSTSFSQPEQYNEPTLQGVSAQQPEVDNSLGARQIVPKSEDYLSQYIVPTHKTIISPSTVQPLVKPPQGQFTMGVTQTQKVLGGSGGGAFSIGRDMLSGLGGRGSLKQVMVQNQPNLPQQPVQVIPDGTITVTQQPQVMQRKQSISKSSINRKNLEFKNTGLAKFRSIELPSIPKSKMSMTIKPTKKTNSLNKSTLAFGKINSDFNINLNTNKKKSSSKFDKKVINTMSLDVRNNVGNVVSGIKNLKKQVRGEFKNSTLDPINIKNIKSKKNKNHKDLNVLNKLKFETHNQLSRDALECKMIPKLKEQCDKVFSRNHITNEVSKFRNDFKDISKMIPTVKGDKAKINEISMVGKSIAHGVDGAHVADVKSMYKNSGATKQMNIGTMEYDYSFVTGKKKPKVIEEFYEEE